MNNWKKISSANNLGFDDRFFDKSLLLIRKNKRPKIEPSDTPAVTLSYD